jgi:hypothetical protein
MCLLCVLCLLQWLGDVAAESTHSSARYESSSNSNGKDNSNSHSKEEHWWEQKFIVDEDEIMLRDGSNILVAQVGSPAYVNYSITGIMHSFHIDPCSVFVVDFGQLPYSDSIFEILPTLKQRKRSLLVLRGAESLRGSNVSRLDMVLSIADKTFDMVDTVIVLTWTTSPLEAEPIINTESWLTHIKDVIEANAPSSNPNALIGRFRRISVQYPYSAFPVVPLERCVPIYEKYSYAACVAFAAAVYYCANNLFFVSIPHHFNCSQHYFYEVSQQKSPSGSFYVHCIQETNNASQPEMR